MSKIEIKDFVGVTKFSALQREIMYALTIVLAALSVITTGWVKVIVLIALAAPIMITAYLAYYRYMPLLLSKFSKEKIKWVDDSFVKDLARDEGVKLRDRKFFGFTASVKFAECYPSLGFILANPTYWLSSPRCRKIALIRHELGHFKYLGQANAWVAAAFMVSIWLFGTLTYGGFDPVLSATAGLANWMLINNNISRCYELRCDKFSARKGYGNAVLELLVDLVSITGKDRDSESHLKPGTRYKVVRRFIRKHKNSSGR